jgi:hypothetical protein
LSKFTVGEFSRKLIPRILANTLPDAFTPIDQITCVLLASAIRESNMAPTRQIRAGAVVILAHHLNNNNKKKRNRTCWVKEWILRRDQYGAYTNLLNELRMEDPGQLKNFIRMSAIDLEELLINVGPKITRQDTRLRLSITPGERLIVTLRFLATGKLI